MEESDNEYLVLGTNNAYLGDPISSNSFLKYTMTKITRAQAARIAALYNNMLVRATMARDPEWSKFKADLWSRAVQSAQALHDEFGIRPTGWEQHIKLDPVEAHPTTITYVEANGQRITKEYKSLEQAHLAAAQIGLRASAVDDVG